MTELRNKPEPDDSNRLRFPACRFSISHRLHGLTWHLVFIPPPPEMGYEIIDLVKESRSGDSISRQATLVRSFIPIRNIDIHDTFQRSLPWCGSITTVIGIGILRLTTSDTFGSYLDYCSNKQPHLRWMVCFPSASSSSGNLSIYFWFVPLYLLYTQD